jgi:hypothetical protein
MGSFFMFKRKRTSRVDKWIEKGRDFVEIEDEGE